MRSVLYTYDFEPITVLNLKPWHLEYLERNGRVVLAVMPPLESFLSSVDDSCAMTTVIYQVTILAERIRRQDKQHMLLFTREEEMAMLLQSCFLPGQISELKDRERDAFAKGVMAAFDSLGGQRS